MGYFDPKLVEPLFVQLEQENETIQTKKTL